MIAPYVLVEGLDVTLHPSLSELVGYVEAIDVLDGVYEAFDAEGTALKLQATSASGVGTPTSEHRPQSAYVRD